MSRIETKKTIWLNYLNKNKRLLLNWVLFVICSFIIEIALSASYSRIKMPIITLKDLLGRIIEWTGGVFESYTKVDGKINPILLIFLGISSVSFFSASIISSWVNGTKDRYDSMFLTLVELKRQIFFKKILYGSLLFLVFSFFFTGNLFNTIDAFAFNGKSKIVFVGVSFILLMICICWNIVRLKENGHTNNVSFLGAFYIIVIWGFYPIKEANFLWIVILSLSASISTMRLMEKIGADFKMKTSIYYFIDKEGQKRYIHYRLDDDRIVCTSAALMDYNSQRFIKTLSELNECDITKDLTDYDGCWLETIKRIKEIRSENKKSLKRAIQEKLKIVGTKMKTVAHVVKKWFGRLLKKMDICRHLAVQNKKYRNENMRLISKCEELEKRCQELEKPSHIRN